jgi:hypothetical protein
MRSLGGRCHPASDPLTHYVIVRADLPRGIQAAQIIHAAGESSPGGLPEGTYAVALVARDELHLTLLAEELEKREVRFVRIREPDRPYDGALMALGLVPGRKEHLRRHLSTLPLLR